VAAVAEQILTGFQQDPAEQAAVELAVLQESVQMEL
jgi:hypothetical protein